MDIKEFYETNANFKRYVDAYIKDKLLTVNMALKHKLVKEVYEYYKEEYESKAR